MRALLDDPPSTENHDQVGHPDGREAVGDQQCDRAPLPRCLTGSDGVALEKDVLGVGVEAGGGLVKHEQQGPGRHGRPSDGDLLPLIGGELDAAPLLAELGVKGCHGVALHAPQRVSDSLDVVDARQVADSHRLAQQVLDPGESWKPAVTCSRHRPGENDDSSTPSTVMPPAVGS